ncbi:MAG: hypothetical protein EBZ48_00345 [Proteobacteria bacterium]|nr:hypothetical protein [Pseudomonadota bacterium]
MSRKKNSQSAGTEPVASPTPPVVSRSKVWKAARQLFNSQGQMVRLFLGSILIKARVFADSQKQNELLLELSWRNVHPATGKPFGGGQHNRAHLPHRNILRAIVAHMEVLLRSRGVAVAA